MLRLFASIFLIGITQSAFASSSLPSGLKPDIIVAADGSGDFRKLQDAIDSVPAGNTERTIIFIKNGTYNEHILVENSFLTLVGEDRFKTRIVWEINDPRNQPDANADGKGIASFNLLNANDIVIDNLTIDNPADLGLKPFVVSAKGEGTRIVIQNAEILGLGGDSLSLWTGGMYYHKNIHVTGTYHFVGPRGTCYMADSLIEELGSVRNALFNEGKQDIRQKFVLHRSRIISEQEFGLGSNFRDAAWYFVDCEFPDTLKADGQIYIQQSNKAKPQPVSAMFQWPADRIYFANSSGPDYPWLKDNIEKSPARMASAISAKWTFFGQWDPESSAPPRIEALENSGKEISLEFAEPVSVKGQPSILLADGKKASYVSGSGTDTLVFKASTSAAPKALHLNGGMILASQASANLRHLPDDIDLAEHLVFKELARYVDQTSSDLGDCPTAIIVRRDNEILFERYSDGANGQSHLGSIDEDTIWPLFSISKSFASALLLNLEHDGILSFDDSVSKYLPEFRTHGEGAFDRREVTIRHVASHLSGVEYSAEDWAEWPPALSSVRIVTKPGEVFNYTRWGMNILERTIEAATGREYVELLSERILEPMGLENTGYRYRLDSNVPMLPVQKFQPEGSLADAYRFIHDGVHPASGLYANARDASRFAQVWVNNGTFEGKRFWSSKRQAEVWKHHSTRPSDGGHYGLLWWVFEDEPGYVMSGSGAKATAISPETGVAITVLRIPLDPSTGNYNFYHDKRELVRFAKRLGSD